AIREVQLRLRQLAWRVPFIICDDLDGHVLPGGLRPPGPPDTLTRSPLRRLAPFAWLIRWRSFAQRSWRDIARHGPHVVSAEGLRNPWLRDGLAEGKTRPGARDPTN